MDGRTHTGGWWLWSKNPIAFILWPLSILFCLLVSIRRKLYQKHWINSEKLSVPVIVVGNISVGGNGKTPVVHSLVKLLQGRGYNPAILTRGYKSDIERNTLLLDNAETSNRAGDEANMLSELCGCPIGVGADRVRTANKLLHQFPEIDILVADDGLQHYALARDIEIIVKRNQALGNGFCLPAGPLREPQLRLQQCDLLIDRNSDDITEKLVPCWNLLEPELSRDLLSFQGQSVDALAGIGFPELFFDALTARGLNVTAHVFTDHHAFVEGDIRPFSDTPLLITHKDAVKIRPFATPNIWVVPLELTLSDDLQYRFFKLLETRLHG